jgi:hypothetical protein
VSILDELQHIYDATGVLTPAAVVDVARPQHHPLHSHFEWDNRTAGEAWRREQAHRLIQSVRIVYREQPTRTVRAFHSVHTPDGYQYAPVQTITDDPKLAAMVLADMERDWRALRNRYDEFAEFWDMVCRETADA